MSFLPSRATVVRSLCFYVIRACPVFRAVVGQPGSMGVIGAVVVVVERLARPRPFVVLPTVKEGRVPLPPPRRQQQLGRLAGRTVADRRTDGRPALRRHGAMERRRPCR